MICDIVCSIKRDFPDCAVTLSIGEKSEESYRRYFESGADRYLLRHETADYMSIIQSSIRRSFGKAQTGLS